MFKSRLFVLGCLVLLLGLLVVVVKSGSFRRWALRTLDSVPAEPLNVSEELRRKVEAPSAMIEMTFIPWRGGWVAQLTADLSFEGAEGRRLEAPSARLGVLRWGSLRAAGPDEYSASSDGQSVEYRGSEPYLRVGDTFAFRGTVPTSTRQEGAKPLVETSWKDQARELSIYLRLHPEEVVWSHRIIGGEASVVFMGPATVLWGEGSKQELQSGVAFMRKQWNMDEPYGGGSLEGYLDWTEWVLFEDGSAAFWHVISDRGRRPTIKRGGARTGGFVISNGRVDFLSGNPILKASGEGEETPFPHRHVRIGGEDGTLEYLAKLGEPSREFSGGRSAYTFSCEGSYWKRPENRKGGSCRGGGIIKTR